MKKKILLNIFFWTEDAISNLVSVSADLQLTENY